MQATKDTFLKTLADRLTFVNLARTVVLDGTTRPAVMTMENETPLATDETLESFQLSWGDAGPATPEGSLMYMDCKVSYGSQGSDDRLRTNRGRTVTSMDSELLRICEQRSVAKCDFTQTPPALLGTNIFWTHPVMQAASDTNGVLRRTATMRVYFFPEAV